MSFAHSTREGLAVVQELVRRFVRHESHYRSPAFDEASTRELFIDPLLQALGWDVLDEAGLGPNRDVVFHQRIVYEASPAGEVNWDEDLSEAELRERAPRVAVPDYALRISTQLRCYVEAKKPSVGVESRAAAYQIKTYAWAQKIPVAVLTDFGQLRLFDCRNRPEFSRPHVGLIAGFDLRFDQFEANWPRLWATLSRSAVAEGSLSKIVSTAVPRGWQSIDTAFLADLTLWRQELAEDLYEHNPNLSRFDLTEASQRILDRLVFIRVVEDRLIEPTLVLRRFARTSDAYRSLCTEFRRLDVHYNGQLFAEHFSERLELSDGWFQHLVERLYPPQSPYRFNVVSPDILGAVYERFLGSEVAITDGQVQVDEKPMVRRQGGVYYTPEWVVRHLVHTTLDPLTTGRSPDAVLRLHVLDPSCGSGSFLLGALDYLIRWFERYYTEHPHVDPRAHYEAPDGTEHLRIEKRNEILTSCIYGVDLDPGAVEVAQMSLYLRVLDVEVEANLAQQLRLLQAAMLPNLRNNIKCGNALLSTSQIDVELLESEERARRINPFDWGDPKFGFGTILQQQGGFDAILGNPPYTRVQVMREFKPEETELYAEHYATAREGSYDIAMPFVEKALQLLRPPHGRDRVGGRLGYIVSRQFCETDAGRPLRGLLSRGRHIAAITDFGSGIVFEGVGAYTLCLHLTKGATNTWQLTRIPPPPSGETLEAALADPALTASLPATALTDDLWTLSLPEEQALLDRLAAQFPSLETVTDGQIYQGVVTGTDDLFRVIVSDDSDGALVEARPKAFSDDQAPILLERAILRPVYAGRTAIRRFSVTPSREWLIFPYERRPAGHYTLISPASMRRHFPQTYGWLERSKAVLEARSGDWNDLNWYAYSRRQNLERFDGPEKVLVPYMVSQLCATYDSGHHFFVNVASGGYGVDLAAGSMLSLRYLAALLNSEILSWALHRYSRAWRGDWFAARRGNLVRLPIAEASPAEQAQVVNLFDACARATARVQRAREGSAERALAERLLGAATDRFDHSVADIYRLTRSELTVVRSALAGPSAG